MYTRKQLRYLFQALLDKGASRPSAMFDVAQTAMGIFDSGVSDNAINILTSDEFRRLGSETG